MGKGIRFHDVNESEVGKPTGKVESIYLNKQMKVKSTEMMTILML